MKEMKKQTLLVSVFVVALILSNICASRVIYTGVVIAGVELTLPGGIFFYPITFLCTDVIGELWGKKQADDCVKVGLICQLLVLISSKIIMMFPAVDMAVDEAYRVVMEQNYIVTIGAITSYLISQSWDVFVFHKIRGYFVGVENYEGKHRWIWNNASTLTSQFLDTIIFTFIGFGIGFGWLFDPQMRYQMIGLCVGQYICKAFLAILDTPFFYLLTRKKMR